MRNEVLRDEIWVPHSIPFLNNPGDLIHDTTDTWNLSSLLINTIGNNIINKDEYNYTSYKSLCNGVGGWVG